MVSAAVLGGGVMRTLILLLCFVAAAPAATWHVIVAGLGGQPDYEARFASLASDLRKLAAGEGVEVVALSGAQATKAAVKEALDKVAASAGSDDALVLTFIGHGTWDQLDYKFNIPGSDVTATELAAWLDRGPARQLVVLATSASGGAIETLRRPGRVLVTATRSGTERNAVVFPRYWVEAFRDANADTDKNGAVSALEAFRYASRKTADFYQTQQRIATEQALLEDTGIREAARNPSPENGQGLLAAGFPVVRFGKVQEALRDPAKQKLLVRKEEIEQAIDKLKYEKAALPDADYRKQLSALLLELAQLQEELEP
jgi:hypothetical protein